MNSTYLLTRCFEEEARFTEAVHRGEEALHRGEHLTHEQVGHRLRRFCPARAMIHL